MLAEILARIIGLLVFALAGWWTGTHWIVAGQSSEQYLLWVGGWTALGAIAGFFVAPYLSIKPFQLIKRKLQQIQAPLFFATIVGLLLGLFASALLTVPLSQLPGLYGSFLPIVVTVLLCYLGIAMMIAREHDLASFFGQRAGGGVLAARGAPRTDQIILDTSVIIDGRIADISQTGFIQGALIIPRFVLDELRHIADSPDPLRRNRGRRGLDMLNKLQKESDVPIHILEAEMGNGEEVDAKLVKLAKTLRCPIITNDFNLNRVAEIQGVRVLNINELANAVKSVVLPGEEMSVQIIQEGKEAGQGVGFLDDGTMVVVENGRQYLSRKINIIVTRVLQTAAGRMIFAQPK